MNQHLRLLLAPVVVAMVAALAVACDAPPAEPTTTPRSVASATRPRVTTTAESTPSDTPRKSEPARCIRPTPDKPVRTQPPGPDPRCPDDPGPKPSLGMAAVRFPDHKGADGAPLEVAVELAKTDRERERGLMYRKKLGEGRGMLFSFEEERVLTFWMHNTCIPLDMLFIARDGTIVGIEESTPTMSDETFSPGCPASYVLEVDAGWARANGVVAGAKVALPPV
jgi:uncharacterized membrane protein (UPF0127 family)